MKISAAEGRVLDVLWRLGPVDAVETISALAEGGEAWGDATVRTLLRRLVAKKAVVKEKKGSRPVFRAVIARTDVAQAESETLIDRFFEGRVSPLVLQFARSRKLDPADLAELKRLVAELEDEA